MGMGIHGVPGFVGVASNAGCVLGGVGGHYQCAGDYSNETDDRFKQQFCWNYGMRSVDTFQNQTPWLGLWTGSAAFSGDQSWDAGPFGQDLSSGCNWGQSFEQPSASLGGMRRPFYINGQITDNVGNPLAAVEVNLFLSSTNQFVATGFTDQNGYYSLPTPFNTQHYIYANYANGTLTGASVDTLTPNF